MALAEDGWRGMVRFPPNASWRTFRGVLLTLALAVLIELTVGTPFRVTNPPAVFIPAIVWTGFSGGLAAAILSAAISWAYSAYFFADAARPWLFDDDDLRRLAAWAITMPLTAGLVGVLHRRMAAAVAAAELASLREAHLKARADAAEELRESERRLAEAERVAHVGWSEVDLVTGRMTSSPEAWRIFGETPPPIDRVEAWETWRNRWPLQVHPDDRARVTSASAAALRGGPRFDHEYRIFRPNGELRVIRVESDVTFGDDGRPLRRFSVIRDITELRRAEDELRASEARFRTFVDHATDAFFLHDEDGTVVDVNQQACESLGYTRQELIGMKPAAFDGELDAAAVAQIAVRLASGEVFAFDTQHRRKDGTQFPVEVRVRPFVMGGRRYGVSLARDITDRKKAEVTLRTSEEALRENQERLRLAVEASGLGPWDWNIQTNQVIFSPEWKRQIGYADHEIAARYEEWASRIHPDDRDRVLQLLRDHLAGKVAEYAVEFRLRHRDGSYRWIYTRGIALRNAQGEPLRMLGCHLDITNRKAAEEALRDSHELLRAVIEGTPDAVFLKDRRGTYLMVNSALAASIGRSVEEVIGRSDRDLLTLESAERIAERDARVIATGEPEVFEEAAIAAGTEVARTLLTTKSPFRDAQGNVIGLVGISRDITELKRLEEQFHQSQKMEAVGRLAGGVAHDFNNLLTVINGYSDMAFGDLASDDPNRELLAEIRLAGDRAATLTRQLLAFSRRQVLQPQPVDLNALLGDLRKLLTRLIGEHIELTFEPHARVSAIVDPAQFEQAIINLAVNARDAMPTGGRLRIETDRAAEDDPILRQAAVKPGQYVLVTIGDSGQGMDDATRSRIFEPFFTTKGPGKGTGLGLAMVYGFVKQSGGHIEVETARGSGSTFTLYLPGAEIGTAALHPPASSVTAPKGTETILLVEDEDAVRGLSRLALQSSGYTVLEARNGQEGLLVAQQYAGRIDLLVTDVVMPRMSGPELADLLAAVRPALKTLFMSGYTDEAEKFETERHFLQKPFTPLSLARKVREVLDGVSA